MSQGGDKVGIEKERIETVKRVLSTLMMARFDEPMTRIEAALDDEFGEIEAMLGTFAEEYARAVTDNEKLNQERLETIERQRMAIADLATPIIDIWDDIITLPIIGIVDTQRSVEMTEKLLQRISSTHAKCVIVDLTGVDVVDTMTADHLVKMIKAAQLLGSQCVVTGISPSIAQTLVQLNVDLAGVKTLRNLKEGLRECFRRLQGKPEHGG